jgi:hypothetical protein
MCDCGTTDRTVVVVVEAGRVGVGSVDIGGNDARCGAAEERAADDEPHPLAANNNTTTGSTARHAGRLASIIAKYDAGRAGSVPQRASGQNSQRLFSTRIEIMIATTRPRTMNMNVPPPEDNFTTGATTQQ